MTAVKNKNEMELLLRPDGRRGVAIAKSYYEKLKLFILIYLDDEAGKTLNDILEKSEKDFSGHRARSDGSWMVLQVKLDLEARGLIKAFIPNYNKRANLLRTTRIGQRLVRQEKTLAEISTFE